jgi:hypothetical protein
VARLPLQRLLLHQSLLLLFLPPPCRRLQLLLGWRLLLQAAQPAPQPRLPLLLRPCFLLP